MVTPRSTALMTIAVAAKNHLTTMMNSFKFLVMSYLVYVCV